MISISDTGIGIAKDQQQFIFDKFYRVPHGNIHQVKGYGLGLFYVKSMMEKFNGEISMKSELGKGTTFTLCFNE
jgi:signal transduction histidine kinase